MVQYQVVFVSVAAEDETLTSFWGESIIDQLIYILNIPTRLRFITNPQNNSMCIYSGNPVRH